MSTAELRRELEDLHRESFGWALRCCSYNRTMAEDVLQTVYLKILDGRARFAGRSSSKTWLFAVIRATAAGEQRMKLLRRIFLTDPEKVAQGVTPEQDDSVENGEDIVALGRALAKLSGRQQEVLHLVFYEDLSLTKAAEVMNVSVGSARRHYERGKKKLRQLLSYMEDNG